MNPFEEVARERKCVKMVLALPAVSSAAEAEAQAARLAKFTEEERARWAAHVGCKAPSATTWARLVELARRRKPAS